MNVGNLAIKMHLDATSIPTELRSVEVNLTSAEKRMAAARKQLESEMLDYTRQYAEKAMAERKWVADATLEYEQRQAQKKKDTALKLEQDILASTRQFADQRLIDQKLKAEEAAAAEQKIRQKGFASIMLASNATGAGIPFPLARILSQQFPGLTSMLSGGLALAGVGVALKVIVNLYDRITHKLDEAKQKEDEYTEAVRRTAVAFSESTLENTRDIDKQSARLAAARGDKASEGHFKAMGDAAEQVDKLSREVDKLVDSEIKEHKANMARMEVWASIQAVTHELFSSEETLDLEKVDSTLKSFQEHYADLGRQTDPIKAMAEQAAYLSTELQKAKNDMNELHLKDIQAQEAQAAALAVAARGGEYVPSGMPRVTDKTFESQQRYIDGLNKIKVLQDQIAEAAKKAREADESEKSKDLGQRHAEELRAQLEAADRLAATARARASAEDMAAKAAQRGSEASIRAVAAAEAEKTIQDFLAEAGTKYLSQSNQKIADLDKFKAKMAEIIPIVREAALSEQTSKALADYNRAVGEFDTKSSERVAGLNAEAEGHGRVAAQQAKELESLVPLQERLAGLKALYESMRGEAGTSFAPKPAIGPPTRDQALKGDIDAAEADYQKRAATITGTINPKIQTEAFKSEMNRIRDELRSVEASGISPWQKVDAEVVKLTRDLSLTPDQIAQVRQGLVALQSVRIANEFENLGRRLQEAGAQLTAAASGDPFAKTAAEAQKIGYEFGLDAKQIEAVRQGLVALATVENVSKAFEAADSISASGGAMQKLREQMAGLQSAQSKGFIIDDSTGQKIQLSGDALSAMRLEMQQIQDEEDKIALRTGGPLAGFESWLDQLQQVQSEGQFINAMLGQMTKGFESTVADSFVKIMETHKNQHAKLMHELRQMWQNFFAGLAKMAIEHGMQKLLQPVAGLADKLFPKAAASGASASSGASLTSAGTSLHTAASLLMQAAAALRASAGGGGLTIPSGVGEGAGAGAGADAAGSSLGDVSMSGPIAFAAEGGDFSPGGSFVSGEAGAERVDLDKSGGAHVTPLGFTMKSGGDTHITNNDFRGAVVTDDLLRKADAARMQAVSEERAVSRAVAMTQELGKRQRPAR